MEMRRPAPKKVSEQFEKLLMPLGGTNFIKKKDYIEILALTLSIYPANIQIFIWNYLLAFIKASMDRLQT